MTDEDRFLTDKRIFLNNPGTQKSDIYYTKDNTEVDAIEATYYDGRFQIDLTNRAFGGGGAVNIPNQMLVGTTYLQVRLPVLVANQAIPRGWLFGLISRIDYVFGGANVGNLSINGQSLFQIIMAQCESEAKRSQILRLAGEEQLVAGGRPVGQIILPLPFSTACGVFSKKPYDTRALSNPIQINVFFNPGASIYGGTGVIPASMQQAQVALRQGELSNPGQGITPILRRIPDALYNYPILHHQSFPVAMAATGVSVDNAALFKGNVNLQQFIDADLVSIYIGVILDSQRTPGGNNTPNPFNYADVQNVEVLWNGTVLFRADENLHELMQVSKSGGASFWENSVVNVGAVAPFTSFPQNNNMVIVDLARVREECFDGKFQNTFRIGQQTLTLSLDVAVSGNYTVFCTYIYNGMISTQSEGTSLIYFN